MESLKIALEAARIEERRPDPILLTGPAGGGKTTLARAVASELGRRAVDVYGEDALAVLAERTADRLERPLTEGAARFLARVAHGTPRRLIALVRHGSSALRKMKDPGVLSVERGPGCLPGRGGEGMPHPSLHPLLRFRSRTEGEWFS